MSAAEWFLIGVVCWVAVVWGVLLLCGINRPTDGDDAEQRRTVAGPFGREHDIDSMRKEGKL
jgi:hypothetical protein